jgi:hypothetical protein
MKDSLIETDTESHLFQNGNSPLEIISLFNRAARRHYRNSIPCFQPRRLDGRNIHIQ